MNQTGPFSPVFALAEGPPAIVFPAVPSSGILPLPDGIGASYVPTNLSYSYVDAWNFSVERLIAGDLTGTITYVGNIGHNLQQGLPLNQAIPGPGPFNPRRPLFAKFGLTQGITDASDKGTNDYNGLQLKAEKRFSHGLSLLASYTYSKSIDNSQRLFWAETLTEAWRISIGRMWSPSVTCGSFRLGRAACCSQISMESRSRSSPDGSSPESLSYKAACRSRQV